MALRQPIAMVRWARDSGRGGFCRARQRGFEVFPLIARTCRRSLRELMSTPIEFVSRLPPSQRRALEALVFFNACQERVVDGILEAIEQFGPPEIVVEDGFLRVRVSGVPEAQALFAVDAASGEPLAVALYVRADRESVIILHVGVREDFAAGGPRAGEKLLLRLVRALRRSSLRIKGIRHIDLYYGTTRASARPRQQRRML